MAATSRQERDVVPAGLPLPLPPAPAAPQPDRRAPRRSEAAAAARRTAAGEIVIAAAARGRLLSPRAGPLRAARRGRPSHPGARRRAPDCESAGTGLSPRLSHGLPHYASTGLAR